MTDFTPTAGPQRLSEEIELIRALLKCKESVSESFVDPAPDDVALPAERLAPTVRGRRLNAIKN